MPGQEPQRLGGLPSSNPNDDRRWQWVNKVTIRPDEIKPDRTAMAIKVVVRVYRTAGGCWCAYIGPSDWPDERVAEEGDAIPLAAALLLFPVFNSRDDLEYYNP